jgi:hypothetical protein
MDLLNSVDIELRVKLNAEGFSPEAGSDFATFVDYFKYCRDIPVPKEISEDGKAGIKLGMHYNTEEGTWYATVYVDNELGDEFYTNNQNGPTFEEAYKWLNQEYKNVVSYKTTYNTQRVGYANGLEWTVDKDEWWLGDYASICPVFKNDSLFGSVSYRIWFYMQSRPVTVDTWDEALAVVHEHYPLVVL